MSRFHQLTPMSHWCGHQFSNELGKYFLMWLLDYMTRLCLVSWENAPIPSQVAVPSCIPRSSEWVLLRFNMHIFAFSFHQVGLNKLSKNDLPSSLWVGTIQFVEGLNGAKGGGRTYLLLFPSFTELRHLISSSALEVEFTSLAPLALRPLGSDWITPLPFSGLQFTESRSWDSSGPRSSASRENLDYYRFWYWEWDAAITNNLKSGSDFATGLLVAAGRV